MKNFEQRLESIEKRLDKLEGKKTDVKFTKIGKLEWSEDLGEMNWFDTKRVCKEAGGRLPTRAELIDLFDSHYKECQELIKGLPSYYFWSATEKDATNAWTVTLVNGNTLNAVKSANAASVRCVR